MERHAHLGCGGGSSWGPGEPSHHARDAARCCSGCCHRPLPDWCPQAHAGVIITPKRCTNGNIPRTWQAQVNLGIRWALGVAGGSVVGQLIYHALFTQEDMPGGMDAAWLALSGGQQPLAHIVFGTRGECFIIVSRVYAVRSEALLHTHAASTTPPSLGRSAAGTQKPTPWSLTRPSPRP